MASITMSKLFLSAPSTLSTTNCNYPVLSFSAKPLRLYKSPTPSYALSFKVSPSLVSLVARTADWAGSDLGEDAEPGLSEWEGGEVVVGEESEGDVVVEGEEDGFIQPPEGAKLFVGNLSYDMDSETLAKLLEPAGIVEISEVIYNRNTDQSRGFGFVTMRTVEEAEKAIEMFNGYDCNGRLLTVNKASSQGSQPPRAERELAPSFRVYVGNLPWQVDNARLEELFSEHGKVLNARVIFDRESGRSRGFGFVTMATKTDQDEAVAVLDGQTLEGRVIRVNVAEERPRNGSF